MLVADASALADYLVGRLPQLRPTLIGADIVHVPEVCDLEVASFIAGSLRGRRITEEDAGRIVVDYLRIPLERHSHEPLLGRILELRHNFTAYDAAYVALAEQITVPLLTADDRFARAVQRHMPHVELA